MDPMVDQLDHIPPVTDQEAEELVVNGSMSVASRFALPVIAVFATLRILLTKELVDSIPSGLGSSRIRGKFSKSDRDGIYYGSEVDQYLDQSTRRDLRIGYQTFEKVINAYWKAICRRYELKNYLYRDSSNSDLLVLTIYRENDSVVMRSYTDFGLLSIGISDDDGIEFRRNGTWKEVPKNNVYVHTGRWLQLALEFRGVRADPAVHRMQMRAGRFFVGYFFDARPDSVIDDKTFRDSFIESYDFMYNIAAEAPEP